MQRICFRQSRLLSSILNSNRAVIVNSIQYRSISENSWATEQLKSQGEKLTPRKGDDILVTDDIVHKPSQRVKDLADQFLELNAIEASQLLKVIQKRIGMSDTLLEGMFGGGGPRVATAGSAGAPAAAAEVAKPAEPAKPKESWDLKLVSFDAASKIKIIKEIRTITALGLKEVNSCAV